MFRRLLQSGPKYFIAAVVILTSITGFGLWLVFRTRKPTPQAMEKAVAVAVAVAEDNSAKLGKIEANVERLILADNDLYDIGTGELLAREWLKNGMPTRLWWEAPSKTFLAQYPLGFVRYSADGKEKAQLLQPHPFCVADDFKWILYSKDKDIWQADVDWPALKLSTPRKVTSISQFNDQNFAGNTVLGTEKTLLVQSVGHVLRVVLATGETHPLKLPMSEIGKRRSPDSKSVVGLQNGQFYCYDVDTDEAKSIAVGRGAMNDYQWLGNDKCVAIAAMKALVMYDRPKHSLTELTALPSPCFTVAAPSPDGRFVFCAGRGNGVLVDLKNKTAKPVTGGAGICWISDDTFAFSREVPDSELRGTWLQTVGSDEKRISNEPFLVAKSGPLLMVRKAAELVVFATSHGLSTANPDGSDVVERVGLHRPPNLALAVETWGR